MHMKNSTISKPWSYLIDLVSTDAVKSHRRSTLWLMLFTLLLLPTNMVAQTDYDTSITFSALAGSPEGFDNEKYPNLFDGKKYRSNSTKWCDKFVSNGGTYVIFEASKAGIPVGYTITTGNDNSTYKGRNPRSWKLYGNNEGKNGAWTLIQEVSNDTKLQDVDCASYDFTCEGSTPYKYFKWEITGIRNKDYIQVGEFELKLNTGYQTYAEFDEGTGTLTFKYGLSTSKPEGAYNLNAGPYAPKWDAQKEKIKTVVFDASFANIRPTSCFRWFYGCKNLTEIKGIENLNTENVTHMNSMFKECTALKSLDLTNFNTAKVTNMSYMFYNCSALASLNVSKFNTAEVKDMDFMFYNCSTLTSLNLSNFNNAKVTTMISMFHGCTKLESLDLSKFNTAEVTNMGCMFYNCSALTSLNLSNFNTAKVTNMGFMFNRCSVLTSLNLSNFNTEKVTDMQGMFGECSDLTSLNLSNFNTEKVTNMNSMFFNCSDLTSLNLSNFNTEKVMYMSNMFYNCNKLTSLDLTSFNTAEVTKMDNMFKSCTDLTSLDLSNFNTAKVTDMNYMFYGCSALTSLDLTSFNTAEVTDMSNMFRLCNKLTSLDLSNFNTAKVENMGWMFKSCYALTSLDLSSFNTANVKDMTQMFYNSNALTTIYASDNFVTGQVTKSINMFQGCNELIGAIGYAGNNTNDKDYANYKTGYFTKLVGKNGNDKIGATGETLTAESLALDDNKDFVAYEPFAAKTASYSRDMNAKTIWATLCLPFEVSLAEQNFRAFNLLSANDATNTIVLEEVTTSIAAGTPVIIKMTNGATELNFSVTNKDIAKDAQTTATADNNYQLQGLYAKKVFVKDTDDNCYIVKGNKLRNPSKLLENSKVNEVNCKAFRAYMVDNNSDKPAGAKMFSIGFDETATAIDNLNTNADDKAIYYDLQGHRLNGPQKGINIVKRGNKTMKVIIK